MAEESQLMSYKPAEPWELTTCTLLVFHRYKGERANLKVWAAAKLSLP